MSGFVPALCATAAGVMAVGSLMNAQKATVARPSACSARRATVEQKPAVAEPSPEAEPVVSARRQTTAADMSDDLWTMTADGEEQFKGQGGPKLAATSKAVQDAKRELAPVNVDLLGTKTRGIVVPVIGRSVEPGPPPKVTGACMFNMPESYADQLSLQDSESA